ncbi:hypothetical protein V6N13_091457 [Hibiscus sabdariffa]
MIPRCISHIATLWILHGLDIPVFECNVSLPSCFPTTYAPPRVSYRCACSPTLCFIIPYRMMARPPGSDEMQSVRIELSDIGVSIISEVSSLRSLTSYGDDDDEDEADEYKSQWGAVERLPTSEQNTTALFDDKVADRKAVPATGNIGRKRLVNVAKLRPDERHSLVEKLVKHVPDDNLRLLEKLRQRIESVGVKLPSVEVRYKNLSVQAECQLVHGKPLPTLWNATKAAFSGIANLLGSKQEAKISILKDVSGIIKPGRMTLLLGPPGCGKSTFLQALGGKLSQTLKVSGEITYNGYRLDEFNPQKTSTYISQYDLHTPEMTVRETLDFSARFQGIGSRAEIMNAISQREKQAGIVPNPDIDAYMKAISIEGGMPTARFIVAGIIVSMTSLLLMVGSMTMSVFLRTQMAVDIIHANYYMGALFFTIIILIVDAFPELSMTVSRLEVFYKQRELCFYPAWAYAIPAAVLKVPLSLMESFLLIVLTYYSIGYSPEVGSIYALLVKMGILAKPDLIWGDRLDLERTSCSSVGKGTSSHLQVESGNTSIGQRTLESRGLNYDSYFYWLSIAALFGLTVLFNVIFTLALTFLKPPGKSRALVSFERYSQLQGLEEDSKDESIQKESKTSFESEFFSVSTEGNMVLPFQPLTVAFRNVRYYVNVPVVIILILQLVSSM